MRSVVYRSPGYALSVLFATWLLQVFCAANAIAADPSSEGRVLYQGRCGGCHSVETNRIGPRHRGVVGRPVASAPDYDYSPALKQLGGTWTPARLVLWLIHTQEMVPRSQMYLARADPEQRRLIIAYLNSVSASAVPHRVTNVATFPGGGGQP